MDVVDKYLQAKDALDDYLGLKGEEGSIEDFRDNFWKITAFDTVIYSESKDAVALENRPHFQEFFYEKKEAAKHTAFCLTNYHSTDWLIFSNDKEVKE